MTVATEPIQSNPTTHSKTDKSMAKPTGKTLENTTDSPVISTEGMPDATMIKHADTVNSTLPVANSTAAYESNSTATSQESNSTATSQESNSTATSQESNSTATSQESNSTATSQESNSTATSHESNSTATSQESNSTATSQETNSTAIPWESNSTATHGESNSITTPWESNSTATPRESNSTAIPRESNSTAIPRESNSTATPRESNSTAIYWESNSTATPRESNSTAIPWESSSTATPRESNSTATLIANTTVTSPNGITPGKPNMKGTDFYDDSHNHFPEDWHIAVITAASIVLVVVCIFLILFRRKLCNRVKYNEMRKRTHSEIRTSQRQKHRGTQAYNDLVQQEFKHGRVSNNIDDIVAENAKDNVRMQSFKVNRTPSWGFRRKSRKVSTGKSTPHNEAKGTGGTEDGDTKFTSITELGKDGCDSRHCTVLPPSASKCN